MVSFKSIYLFILLFYFIIIFFLSHTVDTEVSNDTMHILYLHHSPHV